MTLCVVGATHIDETAVLSNALHPGASNPVQWQRSIGGVALNVFRSARAALPIEAHNVILCGSIGNDAAAVHIQSSLPAATLITTDHATDRYSAILDRDGHLVLGLADTHTIESVEYAQLAPVLTQLNDSDTLVLDTNLTAATLKQIVTNITAPQTILMAVSPVKVMRIADHAPFIDVLFVNRQEACHLSGVSRHDPTQADLTTVSAALAKIGFERHVITDAAQPVHIYDNNTITKVDVPPLAHNITITSVNGAGDAMAGATIAGLLTGLSLKDSVQNQGLGAAYAVLTGTFTPLPA